MKKIYFVRHGQTVWNVENKICGATDIPLTETGHRQAEELGNIILHGDYSIDMILCSPLIRAYDTAAHVSRITGITMRTEDRLTEQCFGRFESTPRDGAEFSHAKAEFINSYDGGETMLRLSQRIYNLLDELKNDDLTYLLVAHNGISRVIHSYFNDMTNLEYASFGIKNCQVLEYTYKD